MYLGTLAALLAALWVPLAFHPFDRSDWWLENALLFAGVALLVATHRVFPLSQVSYTDAVRFLLPAHDRRALHLRRSPVRRSVAAA